MAEAFEFVFWGSAGHAKVLAEIVALQGGRVIALFDNNEVAPALDGVPLFISESGFLNWVKTRGGRVDTVSASAAIGGGRGRDRLVIHQLFRRYGLRLPVLCHPTAVISRTAHLGEGTQVLAVANVAAEVRIGEGCIVNHKASIDHECYIGSGVHIAPGATLCGCVTVGDNVFIGAGATVLPRLSIGENSVIGAGAVVTKNVPSGITVVGNPAKPIADLRKKGKDYD